MLFTSITGKPVNLRCSEIEYFYSEKGLTIIMDSYGHMHKIRESVDLVYSVFVEERKKRPVVTG